MTLNLEIDEETGAMLDDAAKRDDRSRRQQATRYVVRAIKDDHEASHPTIRKEGEV